MVRLIEGLVLSWPLKQNLMRVLGLIAELVVASHLVLARAKQISTAREVVVALEVVVVGLVLLHVHESSVVLMLLMLLLRKNLIIIKISLEILSRIHHILWVHK